MTLAELNGHLDMVTQLHTAREILQDAQARILGAQQYDGMPHAHEAARRTENLSVFLDSRQRDVDRLEKIVSRSEITVRAFVESIEDSRTRAIFDLRFLCGMTWEDVAFYIGGGNSPDAVKMTCYRYLDSTGDLE